MAEAGAKKNAVFVRLKGIADVTPEAVLAAMSVFGKTLDEDSSVTVKRGFAIIEFEDEASAAKAVEAGSVTLAGQSAPIEALKDGPRQPRQPRQPRAAAEGAKEDPTALYVSGLPEEVEKAALRELFGKFGEVRSLQVRKRKQQKRGTVVHAFLAYTTEEAANAALAAASGEGLSLGGAALSVERRKAVAPRAGKENAAGGKNAGKEGAAPAKREPAPKKTVYLGGLSTSVTEDSIRAALGAFGDIKSIALRKRECFASVEFASEAEMQAAQASGPKTFEGNSLTVAPWRSQKALPGAAADAAPRPIERMLHISAFGTATPTEDALKAMFEGSGAISAVSVRAARVHALVEFREPAGAAAALAKAKEQPGLGLPSQTDAPVAVELSEGSRKRNARSRGPRRAPAAAE